MQCQCNIAYLIVISFRFSLPTKPTGCRRKSFLMNDVSEVSEANQLITFLLPPTQVGSAFRYIMILHNKNYILALYQNETVSREKRTKFPQQQMKMIVKIFTESLCGEMCHSIFLKLLFQNMNLKGKRLKEKGD